VVSVVLFGTERDTVLARLEALEARTGKRPGQMASGALCLSPRLYCLAVGHAPLAESIFVTTFRQGRNYFERTVESTARAIIAKTQGRAYRVTIFVDGLTTARAGDLYQPITGTRDCAEESARGPR